MPDPSPTKTSRRTESARAEPGPSRRGRWRKRFVRAGWTLSCTALTLVVGACIHLPADNPAYPTTNAQLNAEYIRIKDTPAQLDRPVVVLSGYRSPGMSSSRLAGKLERLTSRDDADFASLGYPLASTIKSPARQVVALVEERWPSDDPDFTTEVDVVAISMGGIVARVAADDPALRGEPGGKRLRIGTLYTLATPHRGARMAAYLRPDSASKDLAPGSELIEGLNDRLPNAAYKIVPYAILHDRMVGATKTAPPGQDPIWVPGRIFFGHHMISLEKRIYTDIALRLRGDESLGSPSAPPRD